MVVVVFFQLVFLFLPPFFLSFHKTTPIHIHKHFSSSTSCRTIIFILLSALFIAFLHRFSLAFPAFETCECQMLVVCIWSMADAKCLLSVFEAGWISDVCYLSLKKGLDVMSSLSAGYLILIITIRRDFLRFAISANFRRTKSTIVRSRPLLYYKIQGLSLVSCSPV